jgi:hypothetical protein
LLQRTRAVGAAKEAEPLTDGDCCFLVATIARDLQRLSAFPELPSDFPDFFAAGVNSRPQFDELDFLPLFERLLSLDSDADSFFACLGALYKARLKYANILRFQPVPTLDQVGPRGLLQYGSLSAPALTAFLLWRKWIFDIDNRAAQETGYLFEPVIAAAIGGTPVSAARSPIRRARDKKKGRQVDCLKDRFAYEFKIRLTIAASGQGRWAEELEFPVDCVKSKFIPVLIVLDPTPNAKLDELTRVFQRHKGRVYVGSEAWKHLESEAGRTMGIFLESYVRRPIDDLLRCIPADLPTMTVAMSQTQFTLSIDGDVFSIDRNRTGLSEDDEELPEDVDEQLPGV